MDLYDPINILAILWTEYNAHPRENPQPSVVFYLTMPQSRGEYSYLAGACDHVI